MTEIYNMEELEIMTMTNSHEVLMSYTRHH